MPDIIQAESAEDFDEGRRLFLEYAEWLGHGLCFQNFEKELATLHEMYGPPGGCLLLALSNEQVAGCVGLRRLDEGVCEMKRLFVRPAFRGLGLGRELALRIIETARQSGYSRMRLDTIPSQMERAVEMYRSLGFKEIEPYYHNPIAGVVYMELAL